MDRRAAVPSWLFAVLGAWLVVLECQVVFVPDLTPGRSSATTPITSSRWPPGCCASAAPGGRSASERVGAGRRRRARVGARQPLLHGRPLRPRVAADPLARRRRLPPLPGARADRRAALARARSHDVPKTLWTDGSIAALAVTAVSAAVVFQTALDNVVGQDAGGRDRPRLPAHRPGADRRDRRRAGRDRLAPGPHLGDARRRHAVFWVADSFYLVRRSPAPARPPGTTSAGRWGCC